MGVMSGVHADHTVHRRIIETGMQIGQTGRRQHHIAVEKKQNIAGGGTGALIAAEIGILVSLQRNDARSQGAGEFNRSVG
ncbi:MAG: hypothetical protein BWY83_00855 [bacterium ADurb.Bin478]|nr:MAG: hypothetical protein BWY83_00855 [bacterium ADurb.Bin478]